MYHNDVCRPIENIISHVEMTNGETLADE